MWAFFPPHIFSSRKLEVLMHHMCMYVLFPYKSKSDLKENSRRRTLKTSAEERAIYGKPPATLRLSIFTYTAVSGHLTPPSQRQRFWINIVRAQTGAKENEWVDEKKKHKWVRN